MSITEDQIYQELSAEHKEYIQKYVDEYKNTPEYNISKERDHFKSLVNHVYRHLDSVQQARITALAFVHQSTPVNNTMIPTIIAPVNGLTDSIKNSVEIEEARQTLFKTMNDMDKKRKNREAFDRYIYRFLSTYNSPESMENTLLIAAQLSCCYEKSKKRFKRINYDIAPLPGSVNYLEWTGDNILRREPPCFQIDGQSVTTSQQEVTIPVLKTSGFVGTCLKLEKSYFRLTSDPVAEDVRPLHILQKAFEQLKFKEKDWHYLNDQLRAIRQDLSVQSIFNLFTFEVYCYHAKLALSFNDLGQFNMCQTQICYLRNNIDIYSNIDVLNEFTKYLALKLLYLSFQGLDSEIPNYYKLLSRLGPLIENHMYILYVVSLVEAYDICNIHLFIKLINFLKESENLPNEFFLMFKSFELVVLFKFLKVFLSTCVVIHYSEFLKTFGIDDTVFLKEIMNLKNENYFILKDEILDAKKSIIKIADHPVSRRKKMSAMG